jgi:hypothetical protein
MGSFGTHLYRDCNAISDAAKISPRVSSTCAQNAILSVLIIRECKAMGDAANISPRVPSTCTQNVLRGVLKPNNQYNTLLNLSTTAYLISHFSSSYPKTQPLVSLVLERPISNLFQ